MKFKLLSIIFFIIYFSDLSHAQENKLDYPIAPKVSISDNYHGTIVEDPFRLLEDDTLAATQKWVKEENDLTQKYMSKQLFRYPIEEQLRRNSFYSFGALYRSGNYYFELIRTDETPTPNLYLKKMRGTMRSLNWLLILRFIKNTGKKKWRLPHLKCQEIINTWLFLFQAMVATGGKFV